LNFFETINVAKNPDGPAGVGPRVAIVNGTEPGSTLGTWAAKTSDKLSRSALGPHRLVGVLGGVSTTHVAAGLDGGVTNTSKESS
jgi:hypothetical protein